MDERLAGEAARRLRGRHRIEALEHARNRGAPGKPQAFGKRFLFDHGRKLRSAFRVAVA